MATTNARQVIKGLHGRLVKDPTDVSLPFPHGGTEFGLVRNGVFRFGKVYHEVPAEEDAGVITEVLSGADGGVFAAVLRSYDVDALGVVFPDTIVGATTGDRVIKGRVGAGSVFSGLALSANAIVLGFSPDAVDSHPHIVLYNAIPMLEEAAEILLGPDDEFGIAVMFRAAPDSSRRLYDVGRRADFTI